MEIAPTNAPAQNSYLLEAKGISKAFPGVVALDDVSFTLLPGEVHILLGENGAGKSTLMKVIAGAYTPDAGEIFLEGTPVKINTPWKAQSLGIGIIYQEFNLIPYLSVAQNIFLNKMPRKNLFFLDHAKMEKEARVLLESLGMFVNPKLNAEELSTAQQQMVEIGKALKYQSKILIMDEPTASLTDLEINQLFGIIRELKKRGIGIVYISHRLQEINEIGDRVTILRDGKHIATGNVKDFSINELVRLMVGREVQDLYEHNPATPGEEVLSVKDLSSKTNGLTDINMHLRKGEIVGLAGLVGSGRTELARVIFQLDKHESGEIYYFGKPLPNLSPKSAVNNGLGMLPEDRKRQGLALILSVAENTVMASLRNLFPSHIIKSKDECKAVDRYIQDLHIKTPGRNRSVQYLSGGNQQKVVLAKWLCTNSEILIFDEPTRGIDVGSKSEIHAFMNDFVNRGGSILMISSELSEIIGMSDRIYVMRQGKIVSEVSRVEATQEKIMSYAFGASGT